MTPILIGAIAGAIVGACIGALVMACMAAASAADDAGCWPPPSTVTGCTERAVCLCDQNECRWIHTECRR